MRTLDWILVVVLVLFGVLYCFADDFSITDTVNLPEFVKQVFWQADTKTYPCGEYRIVVLANPENFSGGNVLVDKTIDLTGGLDVDITFNMEFKVKN